MRIVSPQSSRKFGQSLHCKTGKYPCYRLILPYRDGTSRWRHSQRIHGQKQKSRRDKSFESSLRGAHGV